MPQFTIKALIDVEIEIDVEAVTEEDAHKMFDSIGITAKLFDVDDSKYHVNEESIAEFHEVEIEATQ